MVVTAFVRRKKLSVKIILLALAVFSIKNLAHLLSYRRNGTLDRTKIWIKPTSRDPFKDEGEVGDLDGGTVCPLIKPPTCDIEVAAYPVSPYNPHKANGSVSINGIRVVEWTTKPTFLTVRLNNTCHVQEIKYFNHRRGKRYDDFWTYHEALPVKAVVLGVAYGYSISREALHKFGVKDKYVFQTDDVRGISAFSGLVAFKSYTLSRSSPDGRRKVIHQRTLDLGNGRPFVVRATPRPYSEIVSEYRSLAEGGEWRPPGCAYHSRLAIIVPYRNREQHLLIFLDNMIRFLQAQMLAFAIYIIEQAGSELFNRAALLNSGYIEARKDHPYDCYVFHDVDLIPEDLTNFYGCSERPRHLVVTRSKTEYEYRGHMYFGGAIMLTEDVIQKINGFPNRMFGWGGEDDDIYARIHIVNQIPITRLSTYKGRYYSIEHLNEEGNPHTNKRIREHIHNYAKWSMWNDGLNTTNYTRLSRDRRELYTRVYVRVPGPKLASDIPSAYPEHIVTDHNHP
ncbi:hypothetical protein LSH36_26g15095 [Paralvinella palmiformis]|uniref:Uncharacterized protein n=1 Tax=Paralvinella palmiformis TaxID=53620 RepID=A0AAD9NGP0_9ANNE|nr:hypothetical protein LSH36_26g15095 [Paralvinella palmiformis]